jgi:hypothetical protein
MRHKKILDVFTIIYKGRQQVGFKVEGVAKYIYLKPENIKQCTGVEITEVEILIGSSLRPELYHAGEKMFNGETYKGEFPIIKDFWIECAGSIENMREANANRLKKFKEIIKIFNFISNNKEIIGFDISEKKPVFVPGKRVTTLTKLNMNEIHILEGSYIAPEYYLEGENIYDGMNREPELCRKSGVILKNLNLRLIGKVEVMYERYRNAEPKYFTGYYDTSYDDDYSNDWLIDVAGSDDPEIMNVAYWNLD